MAKLLLSVSTGYIGCRVDETIDTQKDWGCEWEDLTENEQNAMVNEWVWDNIDCGYRVLEDG